MPIKRCTLDGRLIRSLDDLYNRLTDRLRLPAYFGRNLDALWDTLSTDVEGPFEIFWKHADASKTSMGKGYHQAVKLFKALEKERNDFKLKIEP